MQNILSGEEFQGDPGLPQPRGRINAGRDAKGNLAGAEFLAVFRCQYFEAQVGGVAQAAQPLLNQGPIKALQRGHVGHRTNCGQVGVL